MTVATTIQQPLLKRIVWKSVIAISFLHVGGVYGFYLMLFKAKFATFVSTCIWGVLVGFGVTAGAHRLWSHRSYKARWPLRFVLIIFHTLAMQRSMLKWCRDHRMHHMYSETDADPHNVNRGFFFAHIGWLMVKKHPELKAHTVDVSDLWADPIVRFQKRYYEILVFLLGIVLPTYIPTLWGETTWNAFFVCVGLRSVVVYNITFLVNSAAHIWGNKPYDKSIKAADNKIVSFVAFGEGFHNYHHTFPWDYKTDEFGNYSLNFAAYFIDIMAKYGWAYDLKTASSEIIEARKMRTGVDNDYNGNKCSENELK